MTASPTLQLVGRSSSHFTRVAAIFADELGVPLERVVLYELTSLDATAHGGHPALKIPTLRIGDATLFGTENICRRIAEHAGRGADPRIVFPERLTTDLARCAQELTWHAMSAQVQLIVGTVLGKLPTDNVFFVKLRTGLRGGLAWLDQHLEGVLAELPRPRDVSIFEVSLFCLVEHVRFCATLPLDPYPGLEAFAADFAQRPAATRTVYRYDPRPAQRTP